MNQKSKFQKEKKPQTSVCSLSAMSSVFCASQVFSGHLAPDMVFRPATVGLLEMHNPKPQTQWVRTSGDPHVH